MVCEDSRLPEPASDWERTARVVQPTLATLFFLSSLRLIEAQMAVRMVDRLGLCAVILIGASLFLTPLLGLALKRHCANPLVISALPSGMALARLAGQIFNRPDINWICAAVVIALYGLFLPLYAGWLGSRESRGVYAIAWAFIGAFLLDVCLRAIFASTDLFFNRGPFALIGTLILAAILSSRIITWPRRTVREQVRPLGRGGWADGVILAGLGGAIFLGYALFLNPSLAGPLANATYPVAVLTCVSVAALVATLLYYDADAVQWLDRQPLLIASLANLILLVVTAILVFDPLSHFSLPLLALGLAALMVDLVLFGRLIASTAGHPTIVLGVGWLLGGLLLLGLSAPLLLYQLSWILVVAAGLTLACAVAAAALLQARHCPTRSVRAASWAWAAAVGVVVLAAAVLLIQPAGATPEPRAILTLATYNIRSGFGADDAFDLRRTARVIVATDADVIALQEVNRGNALNGFTDSIIALGDLLRLAGYRYSTFGPAADPTHGNAIFSRYPIVASENAHFTAAEHEPRAVLAARVRIGGRRIAVYATQLTDVGESTPERLAQVSELLDVMAGESLPQVILGDLNARPESEELRRLNAAYADGYMSAGGAAPGNTYPANQPDRRIDYVLIGPGLRPLEGSTPAAELASDHLPVVVRVAVE
jgi:endonuclease/exonuclease/phosphatase family metal-dependent hydrolase